MLFFIYIMSLFFLHSTSENQFSYVMVFMETMIVKNKVNQDIQIYITAAEDTSTGYIETSLLEFDSNYIHEDFNVSLTHAVAYNFSSDFKLRGSGLFNKTFLVVASHPVTIIGINREIPSTDSFLAFPVSSLGTVYYAVSYATNGKCHRPCQFAIIATQNSTAVNITLPSPSTFNITVLINDSEFTNGESFTLQLEQYQSYQIQSEHDLTGTRVEGDQVIAMFSGNIKTRLGESGSSDHLVEQLIPVESLGRSFVVVPTPAQKEQTDIVFRVVATRKDTKVEINNQIVYNLKHGGDWFEFVNDTDAYFTVQSNHPVMVMEFLAYGIKRKNAKPTDSPTDPCLIAVVPQEQWQSKYTYFAPKVYDNYFIVVIEDFAKNYLILNGNVVNNTVNWKSVPFSTLVGGYIKLDVESNLLKNQLDNVTFSAYVYGRASVETHCSPAGVNLDPIKVQQELSSTPFTIVTSRVSSTVDYVTTVASTVDSITTVASAVNSLTIATPAVESTVNSVTIVTSAVDPLTTVTATDPLTMESVQKESSIQTISESKWEFSSINSESGLSHVTTDVESSFSTRTDVLQPSSASTDHQSSDYLLTSRKGQLPGQTISHCGCRCAPTIIEPSETAALVESIHRKLFVDRRKISATIRKKISAPDKRGSSTTMGFIGVAVILGTLLCLILSDFPKICYHMRYIRESRI